MNKIPTVAFAAYSGTGKTTLIEKLIPELIKKRKLIGPYLYLCQIGYLLRIMLANGKESI